MEMSSVSILAAVAVVTDRERAERLKEEQTTTKNESNIEEKKTQTTNTV